MRSIHTSPFHTIRKAAHVLALGAVVATVAPGGEWLVGVIDTGVSGNFPALRLDDYGNAHVGYVNGLKKEVKYAFWDHAVNKWFITTLDRSGGFCSLALDSKQRPHTSYIDYGAGGVMHNHWTGSAWEKQAAQLQATDVSAFTSITLDTHDNPNIVFYSRSRFSGEKLVHLKSVIWNGTYWGARTIDIAEGVQFSPLVSDSHGYPHLAYSRVKYENASLRYSSWNGDSWQSETVESSGQAVASIWSISLQMDKADQPHIVYTDAPNRLVKYATKENGKWTTEVVDMLAKSRYPDQNGIALDEQNNPYISYYDTGKGELKVARRSGGKWFAEVVDQNFAGAESSLQIRNGIIWVTYEDESGQNLKFARRPVASSDTGRQEMAGPTERKHSAR
jgi:hypothetical protein